MKSTGICLFFSQKISSSHWFIREKCIRIVTIGTIDVRLRDEYHSVYVKMYMILLFFAFVRFTHACSTSFIDPTVAFSLPDTYDCSMCSEFSLIRAKLYAFDIVRRAMLDKIVYNAYHVAVMCLRVALQCVSHEKNG